MKITIIILGLINGLYMFIDGIFVMVNGKYIGTEKPGPWAWFFYKLNMDVFKLGPLFIVFGLLWLVFLFGLWTNQHWAYLLGIVVSVLTTWYLPVGTTISVIIFILLVTSKTKLGF